MGQRGSSTPETSTTASIKQNCTTIKMTLLKKCSSYWSTTPSTDVLWCSKLLQYFRGVHRQTTIFRRHISYHSPPIKFHYYSRKNNRRKGRNQKRSYKPSTRATTVQTVRQYYRRDKSALSFTSVIDDDNVRITNTNQNQYRSEPNILLASSTTDNVHHQLLSPPTMITSRRGKYLYHHRRAHRRIEELDQTQFGYEIQDVNEFLTKASIEKPANIPVVLAFPSTLYQTHSGAEQVEIFLPLGMVVNAIFKNEHWLYVQTPHAEEGYITYAACLPLGIIPPMDDDNRDAPCWDHNEDVFPKPSGNCQNSMNNQTDVEKISSKSEYTPSLVRCETVINRGKRLRKTHFPTDHSADNTDTIDTIKRETLLVITSDYREGKCTDLEVFGKTLSVRKGEVVILRGTQIRNWFLVRNKDGVEGFIPASIAGHGFL